VRFVRSRWNRVCAGLPALVAVLAIQWLAAAHAHHEHGSDAGIRCAHAHASCCAHVHRPGVSRGHPAGETHDAGSCPICQVAPTLVAAPLLPLILHGAERAPDRPSASPAEVRLADRVGPESARGPPRARVA